jgi:hypothetical protein
MRVLRCAAAGDRTDSVMAGNTRHIPLVTIAWMFFRALSIGEFKNVSNGLVLGDYMDPSSDYPSFSEN